MVLVSDVENLPVLPLMPMGRPASSCKHVPNNHEKPSCLLGCYRMVEDWWKKGARDQDVLRVSIGEAELRASILGTG